MISGAILGTFSTYIYTTPFKVAETDVAISPWFPMDGDDEAYGLQFSLGTFVDPFQDANQPDPDKPLPTEEEVELTQIEKNTNRNTQTWTGTDPTDTSRSWLTFDVRLLDQTGFGNRNTGSLTGYVLDFSYDHAIGDHLLGATAGIMRNDLATLQNPANWGFADTEMRLDLDPLRGDGEGLVRPARHGRRARPLAPDRQRRGGDQRGSLLPAPEGDLRMDAAQQLQHLPDARVHPLLRRRRRGIPQCGCRRNRNTSL